MQKINQLIFKVSSREAATAPSSKEGEGWDTPKRGMPTKLSYFWHPLKKGCYMPGPHIKSILCKIPVTFGRWILII